MSGPNSSRLSRRGALTGAGAAAGVAAAASFVPLPQASPTSPARAQSAPEKGGGYQVTQHVLRYYQTARV